ncbi:hypothetical protein RFI_07661 [Reticulomyxa filosa]|uniref:Uncharacterized protein n=1 Tax=Reticulomyxa filosa TaxID=46433 RepID=X6NUK1_RETFI|nr:hypothetical protein RFI_07661 [Reticulomyxa filosa]|eukprot:ETO29459.1 hypothetical protein RFI_07661 [Reticulomyxa filosa]
MYYVYNPKKKKKKKKRRRKVAHRRLTGVAMDLSQDMRNDPTFDTVDMTYQSNRTNGRHAMDQMYGNGHNAFPAKRNIRQMQDEEIDMDDEVDFIVNESTRVVPPRKRRKYQQNDSWEQSVDLSKVDEIPWLMNRNLVFARYALNIAESFPLGWSLPTKKMKDEQLLHVGAIYIMIICLHAHIQSLLESIVIISGGRCCLDIGYLPLPSSHRADIFPGMICTEIRIGNMGSGFTIALVMLCDRDLSLFNGSALATLLVKLEQLDLELYNNCIDLPFLYGIITDGHGRWGFVQRNNRRRSLAQDVLTDPLLTQKYFFVCLSFEKYQGIHKKNVFSFGQIFCFKQFSLEELKRYYSGVNNSYEEAKSSANAEKFEQVCASLAQERWQLFRSGLIGNWNPDDSNEKLYSGCVMNFSRKSTSDLHQLCESLYAIVTNQVTFLLPFFTLPGNNVECVCKKNNNDLICT